MKRLPHTPGPWQHGTSNFYNTVDGPSGRKPRYEGDDCLSSVASVQACCASCLREDQDRNFAANLALVIQAPELYRVLYDIATLRHSPAGEAIVDTDPAALLDTVIEAASQQIALANATFDKLTK